MSDLNTPAHADNSGWVPPSPAPELRKVTWPTTEQTHNLSLVVIAVCVVMGPFLGVVDFVLGLLVRLVIG
jgi:preprotein translocase SecE subunit